MPAADNVSACRGVSFVASEPCAKFGSRTGLQQPKDIERVFVNDPHEIAATGVIETVAHLQQRLRAARSGPPAADRPQALNNWWTRYGAGNRFSATASTNPGLHICYRGDHGIQPASSSPHPGGFVTYRAGRTGRRSDLDGVPHRV
jgi:hypothetical protein